MPHPKKVTLDSSLEAGLSYPPSVASTPSWQDPPPSTPSRMRASLSRMSIARPKLTGHRICMLVVVSSYLITKGILARKYGSWSFDIAELIICPLFFVLWACLELHIVFFGFHSFAWMCHEDYINEFLYIIGSTIIAFSTGVAIACTIIMLPRLQGWVQDMFPAYIRSAVPSVIIYLPVVRLIALLLPRLITMTGSHFVLIGDHIGEKSTVLQVGTAVVVTLSHIVLCFASAIITLNLWGGWFSVSRALDPSAISNGTNTTDASTSHVTCVPWASACV